MVSHLPILPLSWHLAVARLVGAQRSVPAARFSVTDGLLRRAWEEAVAVVSGAAVRDGALTAKAAGMSARRPPVGRTDVRA